MPAVSSQLAKPQVVARLGGAGARWRCPRAGPRRPVVAAAGPHGQAAAAAAAVEAPTQTAAAAAAAPAAENQAFNWVTNWYPLVPVWFLGDAPKPHHFTLLGKELVVWRDGATGQWAAARDACPHRLARLSDGLLLGGTLTCAYHGWQFDAAGECTRLPQAPGPEAEQRACSSARCRLASFPTKEEQGLLWVWPDDGPDAAAAAAAAPLPLVPENEDPSLLFGASEATWGYQLMPVDYSVAQENPFDPSHAPYLHDVTIRGMARDKAVPMQMQLAGEVGPAGFSVTHGGYLKGKDMQASRQFIAPATSRIRYDMPNGSFQLFTIYNSPAAPGATHVIFKMVTSPPPAPARALFRLLPQWLFHIGGAADEDRAILHGQQQVLQGQGRLDGAAPPRYFLPTPSDVGVVSFRQWLRQFGGGAVPYEGAPASAAPRLSRAQLLDRVALHTDSCPSCTQGLKAVRLSIGLATAYLCATVAVAAAVLLKAYVVNWLLPPPPALAALAGHMALAGMLRAGLLRLERQFLGHSAMPWERRLAASPLAALAEGLATALLVAAAMLRNLAAAAAARLAPRKAGQRG